LEDYEFGDDLQGISINEVCNLDIFGIPRRRTSKDKGKNRYGNFLLDFCKGNNVFIMNGRLGKDQIGNLTCRNASVVDFCLSNVHFLERLVDFEILEFSTLFSDVHTPFTLTLKKEHSHCEDADPDVIPNESSTEKVKKWEQGKSSIFPYNFDIDKLNFIISKLENVHVDQ
jgi:hypothetical protein